MDRLLGLSGDRVVDPLGPWGDALPPAVADHDAWYLLAIARRQVRSGHWASAQESYRRAEDVATGELVRRTCERERFQLVGWMDPGTTVPHDWTGVLRRALARNPMTVVEGLDAGSVGAQLASGLAAMSAGYISRGSRHTRGRSRRHGGHLRPRPVGRCLLAFYGPLERLSI